MNLEPDNSLPDAEARRFDDLMVRYWDGSLDDAGLAELNRALSDQPELRAAFNELSLQVLAFAERGAAAKATPSSSSVPEPTRSRLLRLVPWSVAVIVALAGMTALLWHPAPTPAPDNTETAGNAGQSKPAGVVYVKNAGGDVQPVQEWAVSLIDSEPPENPSLPPETYLARFGPELPAGWGGNLVFDRLPEDSEGALKAIARTNPKGGVNHIVQSPNAWKPGLFAIHNDSWLHVRFRAEKPGFFHVLVVAREPEIARKSCVVLEGPHFWQNREPGQWHTVHLPFANFRPTEPNRPSERPLVAFIVVFDSQKVDRGVTIERFWVTRGPETQ